MRALRSGLLLCAIAALTFVAERLAGRGADLVAELAPGVQAWNVGGLWFYAGVLAVLALVSLLLPRTLRTPWWPRSPRFLDRWAVLGLCAAVLAGPIGYAILGWEPVHWHAPVSALNFLSGGFLGPLAEEWAFRGILWEASEWAIGKGKWSPVLASVFTSLLFGLWHIPFQDQSLALIVATNAGFGLCLALARWRFRAVGPGVVVHALGNSFFLLTR